MVGIQKHRRIGLDGSDRAAASYVRKSHFRPAAIMIPAAPNTRNGNPLGSGTADAADACVIVNWAKLVSV